MDERLKEKVEVNLQLTLNHNQCREIERLIFEISRRQKLTGSEILKSLKKNSQIAKKQNKEKILAVKEFLIKQRYPLTYKEKKIEPEEIFLNKIPQPLRNNWQTRRQFKPLEILFEKKIKNSYLVDNFKNKFPGVKLTEIPSRAEYLKQDKFKLNQIKKPLVFIVEEKYDFLKPCPCTKKHLRCGYWILNLGFGCPFDCSYCYLQQYTNSTGIVLPANLENFFNRFDHFEKKIKKPLRIGTGEFCDSLALDEVTGYSQKLIPYFSRKKSFFELKTKSDKIENILSQKPSPNIIISWSLNPQNIIDSEEKSSSPLEVRLKAAKEIQNAGFKVAFHFDPIIHYPGWEAGYRNLIEILYHRLKPPFAWISLGTLRCQRALKPVAEQRFPGSNIFYGELFIGEDKKLRYPKFLRRKIYLKTITWIKKFDSKTPLYLCMESQDIWKKTGGPSSQKEIEENIIRANL